MFLHSQWEPFLKDQSNDESGIGKQNGQQQFVQDIAKQIVQIAFTSASSFWYLR